jgi:hypothetical protein
MVKKWEGALNQRLEKISVARKAANGLISWPTCSGLVNQELLLPIEYLAAEDRILRASL